MNGPPLSGAVSRDGTGISQNLRPMAEYVQGLRSGFPLFLLVIRLCSKTAVLSENLPALCGRRPKYGYRPPVFVSKQRFLLKSLPQLFIIARKEGGDDLVSGGSE